MSHPMLRRILARSAAVLAVVALTAAAAEAQEKRFDGVTVRFATFGGGWDKAVHDFAGVQVERLGAKIVYFASLPPDTLAKLIAARGREMPFDVIEMSAITRDDTMEGKFLQKINLANIPNTKELFPGTFDEWKVPSWVVQEGIVYNADKFKELGLPKPEKYSDLLHPKLTGRVSILDVGITGAIHMIAGMAVEQGSRPEDYVTGLKMLSQVKAYKFWQVGAQVMTGFTSGDVWAATMHAGFAIQGARDNMPLEMAHPRVGRYVGILNEGWLGIVAGTNPKVAEAAEAFINAYVSAEAQEGLARRRGIVPVNKVALGKLGDDPILKRMLILGEADVPKMLRTDLSKIDRADFVAKWNRAVAK
ncbi:MAG: ABC transporter substrate-binding protein [Pseudomonadota bacterium]